MSVCTSDNICTIASPETSGAGLLESSLLSIKSADLIFVTDPICSHCWAIEPVWRRLVLNYEIKVHYIHGGLLPGWEGFADSGNAISKPADVVPHWQHVAQVYQQPIDPSIWLNDPISNSYIFCKALLAVRALAPAKESKYLRKLREYIFLFARNMETKEQLAHIAACLQIDPMAFLVKLDGEEVAQTFEAERSKMAQLKARGFPSLIFQGSSCYRFYGSQSYSKLEPAVTSLGSHIVRRQLSRAQKLAAYNSWTTREVCEVFQIQPAQVRDFMLLHGFSSMTVAGDVIWVNYQ